MKRAICLAIGISGAAITPALAVQSAELKQKVIRWSIDSYPGPCACPYSVMRTGRSCGGRSSYSRPGGAAPICYPADVTPEAIEDYRQAQKAKR